jgi:hypothetical protein
VIISLGGVYFSGQAIRKLLVDSGNADSRHGT